MRHQCIFQKKSYKKIYAYIRAETKLHDPGSKECRGGSSSSYVYFRAQSKPSSFLEPINLSFSRRIN